MIARQGSFRCRSRTSGPGRPLVFEIISRQRVTAWKVRRSVSNSSADMPSTNVRARHSLSRMPKSARRVRSEGINRLPFSPPPNEWFETVVISHIHGIGEQIGEVLGDANILKQVDWRVRFKLDQGVDVAGGWCLTACDGAKQRDMQNPATAEFRFAGAPGRDDASRFMVELYAEPGVSGQNFGPGGEGGWGQVGYRLPEGGRL